MFCLFDNIYICGVNEISSLNLLNFNYILNCSMSLNNIMSNPNFINLNFDKPINMLVNNIIYTLDFIFNSYKEGHKIILLDETGKDNSIFIGIMFLMKYYNTNFDSIYNSISNYASIYPKDYYNPIISIEYYILRPNQIVSTNHLIQK